MEATICSTSSTNTKYISKVLLSHVNSQGNQTKIIGWFFLFLSLKFRLFIWLLCAIATAFMSPYRGGQVILAKQKHLEILTGERPYLPDAPSLRWDCQSPKSSPFLRTLINWGFTNKLPPGPTHSLVTRTPIPDFFPNQTMWYCD